MATLRAAQEPQEGRQQVSEAFEVSKPDRSVQISTLSKDGLDLDYARLWSVVKVGISSIELATSKGAAYVTKPRAQKAN